MFSKCTEHTLTPKIPCVFGPNCVVFDIVGEIIFSKMQSMITWQSNPRIFWVTLVYINLKKL
jgi:hypothetical protein